MIYNFMIYIQSIRDLATKVSDQFLQFGVEYNRKQGGVHNIFMIYILHDNNRV